MSPVILRPLTFIQPQAIVQHLTLVHLETTLGSSLQQRSEKLSFNQKDAKFKSPDLEIHIVRHKRAGVVRALFLCVSPSCAAMTLIKKNRGQLKKKQALRRVEITNMKVSV